MKYIITTHLNENAIKQALEAFCDAGFPEETTITRHVATNPPGPTPVPSPLDPSPTNPSPGQVLWSIPLTKDERKDILEAYQLHESMGPLNSTQQSILNKMK